MASAARGPRPAGATVLRRAGTRPCGIGRVSLHRVVDHEEKRADQPEHHEQVHRDAEQVEHHDGGRDRERHDDIAITAARQENRNTPVSRRASAHPDQQR